MEYAILKNTLHLQGQTKKQLIGKRIFFSKFRLGPLVRAR